MLTGGTTAGDVLNAVVQDASTLNAGPSASIAAYLTSIETVNFTALNDSDGGAADGSDSVEINGAFWLGTDVISSIASDASLTVYNVNTLAATSVYGDIGALTATMTIRMDHTGNDNNLAGAESDMTVLFDEDYLIAGTVTATDGAARFYLLDQDGALQDDGSYHVVHFVNALGEIVGAAAVDEAVHTKVFMDRDGISFDLDGVPTEVRLTAAQIDTVETHAEFAAALSENAPAGITIALDETDLRTTFLENGTAYSVPAIVVTAGGAVTNPAFTDRADAGAGEFNIFGRFTSEFASSTTGVVEVNVELNKVGRAGDGGDLIIGGMEDDGIETFHVEVQGRADQPSSLASLASTNNVLETVNVTSAAGSLASLEIGNGNTSSYGLTDVRVFNASAFDNGATIDAVLTNGVVAKYGNLTDVANPDNDDNDFSYTFGDGDDSLTLEMSASNLQAAGTASFEDFNLVVDMGDGDDAVIVGFDDGDADVTDAWYMNTNDNDIAELGVSTGAGDDTIVLAIGSAGGTAFDVDAGAGDDAVYTDNTGSKAVWVYNTTDQIGAPTAAEREVGDLDAAGNASMSLYNASVTFSWRGVESTSATITDYRTTTLEMNNIIKDLINNDVELSKILLAEDGPSNTLVLTSLIDGVFNADDVRITATHTALVGASSNTLAAFNSANGLALADLAELNTYLSESAAALNTGTGDSTTVSGVTTTDNTAADEALIDAFVDGFTQALGQDNSSDIAGTVSDDANANVVTDGTGVDVIVLSTSGEDLETVNLAADTSVDHVVNVTLAEITGMNGDVIVASNGGSAFSVAGTDGTIILGDGIDTITIVSGEYTFVGIDVANDLIDISAAGADGNTTSDATGAGDIGDNSLLAAADGTAAEFSNIIEWYDDGIDTTVYVDVDGDGALGAGDLTFVLEGTNAVVEADILAVFAAI